MSSNLFSIAQRIDTLARLTNPESYIISEFPKSGLVCYLQVKRSQRIDTVTLPYCVEAWAELKDTFSIQVDTSRETLRLIVNYPYFNPPFTNHFSTRFTRSTCWDIDRKKIIYNVLLLGKINNPSVSAISTDADENNDIHGYLLMEINGKRDSILFDSFSDISPFSDFEIQSRQLDNKGSNEIIISYTNSFVNEIGHAGGATASTITQVWNIDTKQKLFQAMNYRYLASGDEDKSCEYEYHISFNNEGQIIINNLVTKNNNETCSVDKKQGVYSLVDGQYILTKPLPKRKKNSR